MINWINSESFFGDIISIFFVLAIFAITMLSTKHFKEHLSPELSRKIVHIVMGSTSLIFPFIFTHKISVVILALISLTGLCLLRINKKLHAQLSCSILGVERKSYGDFYLTIAITLMFVLHTELVQYLIPMLVLTFADSGAALVGVNYGKKALSAQWEDKKSTEGSFIFFMIAFLCTLIPLQLLTEVGRAEVLLVSALVGILATIIEAVAENGMDNLTLPLLTYAFVYFNMDNSLDRLLECFGFMFILFAIILFLYKVMSMSKLSAWFTFFAGYTFIGLGGFLWFIPPLLSVIAYSMFPLSNTKEKAFIIPYKVMEANTSIGLICLWFFSVQGTDASLWYLASSFSFACFSMLNIYTRYMEFITKDRIIALKNCLIKSFLFVILPSFLLCIYIETPSLKEYITYILLWILYIPLCSHFGNSFKDSPYSNKNPYIKQIPIAIFTVFYLLLNI